MSDKSMISNSSCIPSATVKFNFNEMDKSEILQLLAFTQSELEAREIVIATLKSEKCKQLLYQAKYGRLNTALVGPKSATDISSDNWSGTNSDSIFSIYDPFVAMQRDIQYVISGTDSSVDCPTESNLKPVYDSQLNQLENLISSQKKAQMKMKDQILYLEKKCVKLTQALEDERNKHERDAAQGDDVLVMLEKERERLKSELEYEKSHSRKLERELRRMVAVIEDQKIVIQNQRLAASVILKAKKQMETDVEAVNLINKTTSDLVTVDTSLKNSEELSDNMSGSQDPHLCSQKTNVDPITDQSERHKENSFPKPMKYNAQESLATAKHVNKYPHTKEYTSCTPGTHPDPVLVHNHPITFPLQKSRTGKQPESLLWKTYDPKNNLPSSGHSPSSMTTKSPSNIRRPLPNSSIANSIPVSSLTRQNDNTYFKHPSAPASMSTVSPAITPYQKILSTPPPNSITNQAASFQSSLTSYSLFNICSPTLQSLGCNQTMVATVYKSTISSTKSELGNCQPLLVNTSRARLVANPVVTPSSVSNSSMLRSGDSSPAIPKHVYVNGK